MKNEFDYSLLEWFGKDVYISANVEIKRPELVSIGNHVAIDSYFYATTILSFGSYIHIAPMVSIIGGKDATLWLGNFCTIAAGCRIIVRGDEHLGEGLVSPVIPFKYRDRIVGAQTIMESFSSLGSNVVVMPNITIAEGVVIGANSLVTKSIKEPWTVWVGSPARKVKDRPREKMLAYAQELMKNE